VAAEANHETNRRRASNASILHSRLSPT
jgi:hypothetical protein